MLEDWYTRFRGFVSSYEYDFDPSQLVNRVTISLVDIFEIVNAVQMFPGYFGDPPPAAQEGQVVFMEDTLDGDEHGMQRRVIDIIGDETEFQLLARQLRDPGGVLCRLQRQRLHSRDELLAGRIGDGRDPGRGGRGVPRRRQRLRRPPGPSLRARALRPLRPGDDGGRDGGLGLQRLERRRRSGGQRARPRTRPTSAPSRSPATWTR